MSTFILKDNEAGAYFCLTDNGETCGISSIFASPEDRDAALADLRIADDCRIDNQTGQSANGIACPKFELIADKVGQFRYRFRNEEGTIIFTSVVFDSQEDCVAAIKDLRANAALIESVEE